MELVPPHLSQYSDTLQLSTHLLDEHAALDTLSSDSGGDRDNGKLANPFGRGRIPDRDPNGKGKVVIVVHGV